MPLWKQWELVFLGMCTGGFVCAAAAERGVEYGMALAIGLGLIAPVLRFINSK